MKIRFSPQALVDLEEVLDYYRTGSERAEKKFVAELDQALRTLSDYPVIAPQVQADIRRYKVQRFPFGIYYAINEVENLLVLSILHLKRDPETINERLDKCKTVNDKK